MQEVDAVPALVVNELDTADSVGIDAKRGQLILTFQPTFPISDCRCPKNPPSFATVMVGASTNAVNYPIGLTNYFSVP